MRPGQPVRFTPDELLEVLRTVEAFISILQARPEGYNTEQLRSTSEKLASLLLSAGPADRFVLTREQETTPGPPRNDPQTGST
jgi:hypothetical protein